MTENSDKTPEISSIEAAALTQFTLLNELHKSINENQLKQEKFNEEMLEKQRSSEIKIFEKLESIDLKLKAIEELMANDTSSESEDEEDSRKMIPITGKSFVLKHVFKNVSDMKEGENRFSEVEEHFGVPWRMTVTRNKEHLALASYLTCLNNTKKWSIDLECKIKLFSIGTEVVTRTFNKVFENPSNWGWPEYVKWEEMEKDYMIDGSLTIVANVKINIMAGIYKEDLRPFDQSVMEVSDVVLIVKEQKFYVSKLTLASQSFYFKSLFLGNFQESKKSEIPLTGIDADDFQNFLEVVYGESAIDEVTVEGILLVADMYDTPIVIRKCEDFLMKTSSKKLKKKLEMSIRYNLEQLKKKSMSEIKTAADIRSVLPGDTRDMDQSIMRELFDKFLDLHQ